MVNGLIVVGSQPTTDATELRRQRGRAIADVTKIAEKQPGLWTVPSQTGEGKYWVKTHGDTPTCTCPDFEKRNQPCKHIFAVQYTIEHEQHPDGSQTETVTPHGRRRMTRGLVDSLLITSAAHSSATSCRFIPATSE
jgi:hypothetical protein